MIATQLEILLVACLHHQPCLRATDDDNNNNNMRLSRRDNGRLYTHRHSVYLHAKPGNITASESRIFYFSSVSCGIFSNMRTSHNRTVPSTLAVISRGPSADSCRSLIALSSPMPSPSRARDRTVRCPEKGIRSYFTTFPAFLAPNRADAGRIIRSSPCSSPSTTLSSRCENSMNWPG